MPIYRVPVDVTNPALPSPAVNVFHVRTVETSSDPGPALAALREWYVDLAPYLATNTVVKFPNVVVEITDNTEQTIASVPADVTTTSSNAESMGLALVIAWKTSIRARRGRGRTFFGPLSAQSADAATGEVSTAALAVIDAACQQLVDASLAGSGWSLGVWGQQDAGVEEPKVLRDWTGWKVNPRYGYLRSRRD